MTDETVHPGSDDPMAQEDMKSGETRDKSVIYLPEKDDMLERLNAVDDSAHAQEKFYPILLNNAGERKAPQGVVMMLVLAINDYTVGLPPIVGSMLLMQMDEYIDALIKDPEVAQKAKDFYKQVAEQK